MARRAPRKDSMVRRISSSRACVMTMIVTSSGISFCSMRSRTVWKSVSEADGNPTSISLRPTRAQRLEQPLLRFAAHGLEQRLVAVAQVGAAPHGHRRQLARRPLPVGQVDGREGAVFLRWIFQHGRITLKRLEKTDATSPRVVRGSSGFQSCMRRLVARVYVRLGRKKEERTSSAARCGGEGG